MSLSTPCYIFDVNIFKQNIADFYREFQVFFPNLIVAYSFKTNSIPAVLTAAMDSGCYGEVVSDTEYELARKMGFSPEKIVFNGPVKEKDLFETAVNAGSIVNIDSHEELRYISKGILKNERGVGVRVNFDLESYIPGQTLMGELGGRFGYNYENGELHKAIEICRTNNVNISGLHMHVSSKTKSVEVYQNLAEMAVKIIREEDLAVRYIDIGGGFFGGDDGGEAYKLYAESLYKSLKSLDNITLIVEPGASLVATAFSYLVSVKDVKKTNRACFVVTDGTRLHIDPFFRKNNFNYSCLYKDCPENKDLISEQVLCGYTCMENDRFMSIQENRELFCGDQVVFRTVGSYTMCFNPLFIKYLPRVFIKNGENYTLVRDAWSVDEYLQKCIW